MKHLKSKRKISPFDILNYIFLGLCTLACIYPFYYILIYSLSDPRQVARGVFLLPVGFTFFNYESIFTLNGIFEAFFISLLRTSLGTLLTVGACSITAYIVSKPELPFRKVIYRFIIITMYLNSGMIPMYLTIKAYGLRNNFLVYILPTAMSAFYIILLKTYIEQLPASLEEAAKLDGAGYFTVFTRIIFPLAKPIVATVALFAAVGQWNAWFDTHLYVTRPELKTLQYVLYTFLNEAQQKASSIVTSSVDSIGSSSSLMNVTPDGIRMTITVVATLPIFIVYPFLQKYFAKGIMLGAVKG